MRVLVGWRNLYLLNTHSERLLQPIGEVEGSAYDDISVVARHSPARLVRNRDRKLVEYGLLAEERQGRGRDIAVALLLLVGRRKARVMHDPGDPERHGSAVETDDHQAVADVEVQEPERLPLDQDSIGRRRPATLFDRERSYPLRVGGSSDEELERNGFQLTSLRLHLEGAHGPQGRVDDARFRPGRVEDGVNLIRLDSWVEQNPGRGRVGAAVATAYLGIDHDQRVEHGAESDEADADSDDHQHHAAPGCSQIPEQLDEQQPCHYSTSPDAN